MVFGTTVFGILRVIASGVYSVAMGSDTLASDNLLAVGFEQYRCEWNSPLQQARMPSQGAIIRQRSVIPRLQAVHLRLLLVSALSRMALLYRHGEFQHRLRTKFNGFGR